MGLPASVTAPSGEGLRSILAATPDGVLVVDADDVVLFANPAATRMIRSAGAALVGTRFDASARDADLTEIEFPATGVTAELRVSRLRWKSRPAMLVMLHDVTARRRAADQRSHRSPPRSGSATDRRELAEALDQAERVACLGGFRIDFGTGRVTYTSGFTRTIGRELATELQSSDPLLGENENVVHPADRERVSKARIAAMSSGTPSDLEFRIIRPDGEERVVRLVTEPVRDADGRVAGLRGTLQDVTAQRRAEESRRRSHQFLEGIADNTPAAIYVKDRDGHHLFANTVAARLYGRAREELAKLTLFDLVPRESAERMLAQDAEVLGKGTSLTVEETIGGLDGSTADWLTVKFPIVDHKGRPYAVGGVSIDITERKRAEEALRLSEERFRLLAESSQDMVYLTRLSPDHRVEYVTPASSAVLGFAPEELTGDYETVLSRLHPEDRIVAESLTPDSSPVTVRLHRADGDLIWAEIRLTEINDDTGQAVALQGNVRDVTGRVEAEQERERMVRQLEQAERLETLGRLAGGVAHDVNNLLAVILGTADLLAEDLPPGDPRAADVERISQTAQRGAGLTRQLLIFSRREPSSLEDLDVTQVVANIEDMLRRTIGEDVEFVTRLSPGLKAVSADRSKLEQVVLNLVVNARTAMPGGGRLTVRTDEVTLPEDLPSPAGCERPVPAGTYVRLTVADTGEGMTPEVARRAFEPFFSTRARGEGSGLGLATVHGVVTEAGGHIRLDSGPGVGTTFEVYLPAGSACAEPAPDTARDLPRGRGETVLLVEDEEPVREVMTRILTRGNYRLLPAHDAAEALRICGDPGAKVDLLLTDVIMPGMSGFQLGERLRAVRPGLPVLYMSGYAEGQRPPGDGGPDQAVILSKPFDAGTALRRIREALDNPTAMRPGPDG